MAEDNNVQHALNSKKQIVLYDLAAVGMTAARSLFLLHLRCMRLILLNMSVCIVCLCLWEQIMECVRCLCDQVNGCLLPPALKR